jgi:site-specific DNA recombinase
MAKAHHQRHFADYLRLRSVGELSASLEREAIKPRSRLLSNGKTIAAGRFMVGPLAYLLKNRFYVGDVVYKGEVHKGEHTPILDRELFEAVQARLAERKVLRKLARSKSSAILRGLIFDDRGHPMSQSHANKKGVRYRYYVSHALLQNRNNSEVCSKHPLIRHAGRRADRYFAAARYISATYSQLTR